MSTSRRDFIRYVVAGSVAAGCPIDLSLLAADASTIEVDGEHNQICHEIRDGHKFAHPEATQKRDVVIVGGGVSGLAASYLLRDKDFLLLEKEPHWGGNSYLEEYNGVAYATGGAFTEGDTMREFTTKLGLPYLPVDNWDGTIANGEFVADTWGAGLDQLPYPQNVRDSFKKFRDEMLKIDLKARYLELDNVPLSKFTAGYAKELQEWWDGFGPSNWGAKTDESAAILGIYEVQSAAGPNRKDDRFTWPGGLGAINKKLVEILHPQKDRMLLDAATVAVIPQKHGVNVTYLHGGKLQTVEAKGVIMAIPKFITVRLVEGMPQKQKDAIAKMRYIPYAVVNLIYDKPVFNRGYDTWCPGNSFTDFIVADWTVRNQPGYKQKYNILTCYTPLQQEQRGVLLTEEGSRQLAANVLRDFKKLLPETNVNPVEVQIYRRGHPLYQSLPGNYTQILPQVRQPMERVFFANTDSQGPVSTTPEGITAARRCVKEYEAMIAGKPIPTEQTET
jgi:protoporphyrinogen/coproporphyrinogen III oxidase